LTLKRRTQRKLSNLDPKEKKEQKKKDVPEFCLNKEKGKKKLLGPLDFI
jgi:hypothetical protein